MAKNEPLIVTPAETDDVAELDRPMETQSLEAEAFKPISGTTGPIGPSVMDQSTLERYRATDPYRSERRGEERTAGTVPPLAAPPEDGKDPETVEEAKEMYIQQVQSEDRPLLVGDDQTGTHYVEPDTDEGRSWIAKSFDLVGRAEVERGLAQQAVGEAVATEGPGIAVDIGKGIAQAPWNIAEEAFRTGLQMSDLPLKEVPDEVIEELKSNDFITSEAIDDAIAEMEPLFTSPLGKPEGVTGQVAGGLAEFMMPFLASLKALKVMRLGANLTKTGFAKVWEIVKEGALAELPIALFLTNPKDPNVANVMRDWHPWLRDSWLAYMASDPGDTATENRLKNVLINLGTGALADGTIQAIMSMARAAKKLATSPVYREEVGQKIADIGRRNTEWMVKSTGLTTMHDIAEVIQWMTKGAVSTTRIATELGAWGAVVLMRGVDSNRGFYELFNGSLLRAWGKSAREIEEALETGTWMDDGQMWPLPLPNDEKTIDRYIELAKKHLSKNLAAMSHGDGAYTREMLNQRMPTFGQALEYVGNLLDEHPEWGAWYADAWPELVAEFGEEAGDKIARLVAIFSAKKATVQNGAEAINTWNEWEHFKIANGREPTKAEFFDFQWLQGGTTGTGKNTRLRKAYLAGKLEPGKEAQKGEAYKVMKGDSDDIFGTTPGDVDVRAKDMKIRHFYWNLRGHARSVTSDRWIIRWLYGRRRGLVDPKDKSSRRFTEEEMLEKQGEGKAVPFADPILTKGQSNFLDALTQQLADEAGAEPRAVQAAIWVAQKLGDADYYEGLGNLGEAARSRGGIESYGEQLKALAKEFEDEPMPGNRGFGRELHPKGTVLGIDDKGFASVAMQLMVARSLLGVSAGLYVGGDDQTVTQALANALVGWGLAQGVGSINLWKAVAKGFRRTWETGEFFEHVPIVDSIKSKQPKSLLFPERPPASYARGTVNSELSKMIKEAGGITYHPGTGKEAVEGYAVAPIKVTETILAPEELTNENLASHIDKWWDLYRHEGMHFGAWFNEDTGKYVLDASMVMKDRLKAAAVGKSGDQDALWALREKEQHNLPDLEAEYGERLTEAVREWDESPLKAAILSTTEGIERGIHEAGTGGATKAGVHGTREAAIEMSPAVELIDKAPPAKPKMASVPESAEFLGTVSKAEGIDIGDKTLKIHWDELRDDPEKIDGVVATLVRLNEGRIDEARRGVQTVEVRNELAEMLGMADEDLLAVAPGTATNWETTKAFIDITAANLDTLSNLTDEVLLGNADNITRKAFRSQLALTEALLEKLYGIRAESGRSLSVWKSWASKLKERNMGDVVRALPQRMKSMELTTGLENISDEKMAHMIKTLSTPAQKVTFIKQVETNIGRAILTAWINGLLSGTQTHFVNMISNAYMVTKAIPERWLAGKMGSGVEGGEAMAMAWTLKQSWKEGFQLAGTAFRDGVPIRGGQKMEISNAIRGEAFGVGGAFGDALTILGEYVSMPGRFLMSADEFFKGINYRMELNALAYREVFQMGDVTKAEALARAKEIYRNPSLAPGTKEQLLDNDLVRGATKFSEAQTFTNAIEEGTLPAEMVKAIKKLRGRYPGLAFVFPFLHTPYHVGATAFRETPLSLVSGKNRKLLTGKTGSPEEALYRGKLALGTMVVTIAGWAAMEGRITGEGPKNWKLRKQMEELEGWQRYSIVGDEYSVQYSRLDPLGWQFGMVTDLVESMHAMDDNVLVELVQGIVHGISAQVQERPYMRGLALAMDAIDGKPGVLRRFTGSFIPTGVRQLARLNDPIKRETRGWLDMFRATVPGIAGPRPTITSFGDMVALEGGFGPDVMSPFYIRSKEPDPNKRLVAAEMRRLGVAPAQPGRRFEGRDAPSDMIPLGNVDRFRKAMAAGVELTDDEMVFRQIEYGKAFLEYLKEDILDDGKLAEEWVQMLPDRQAASVSRASSWARGDANEALMDEYPTVIERATALDEIKENMREAREEQQAQQAQEGAAQ